MFSLSCWGMTRALIFIFLLFLWTPIAIWGQVEFLSSIEDTLCPGEWLYAGPFSAGAREGVVGVIEDAEEFRPFEGVKHRNTMTLGGEVSWKKTNVDSLGWVNLEFEDVWWDTLMDIYGVAGIVNAGLAYTEFENTGEKRALILAEKVGSFYLNGMPYYGDPYGHDLVRIPVVLKDGTNRVLVNLGGYGDHRFKFKILPSPWPVMLISKDATLPDIIEHEKGKLWAGIPVVNTTSRRLKKVEVVIGDGELFKQSKAVVEDLVPLSMKKVPIEIEVLQELSGLDTISIPVTLFYGDYSLEDYLKLRIREKGESFKKTFISRIDNSCQYYAVLPPEDYDPNQTYALILTLHGAGVEASGQVNSYQKKDWAFVVAPTNRRRFGFDWQDWGRLDALEVLDLVKEEFPIDSNRVYLTGHSMGGHGCWHVALTHPDLFAAFAPGAGWTCFQLYVPWFLQKSYVFAHPQQIAIRDMSLREDITPDFVENALNLPVFIFQGGSDDNVPPMHARLFAQLFEEMGYEYRYKEVPGKGHWYTLDTLGGIVCVDDPEIMEFFKNKTRSPYPDHVIFKTNNIGQSNRSYWVVIDEQEKPFFESLIEAYVKQNKIELTTQNIKQFTLSLSENLVPPGRIKILINGKEIPYDFKEGTQLTFSKKGRSFRMGKLRHRGLKKCPEFYGPIKQAYFSPFALIYGTKGDMSADELTLHQARQEAFRWWRRGNGFAEILPDTEVTSEIIDNYNLILFGGPEENLFTARIQKDLPIRVEKGKVIFGGEEISGNGLAAEFVYPNPLNPGKFLLVRQGTDFESLKLSTFFGAIYSGAGLPDFMIFDKEVKKKGWAGVLCAGFFDSDWKIDDDLLYLQR